MDVLSRPSIEPLVESLEYDDVEAELKRIFIDLIETYIRPGERDLNVVGNPHLGSFDLVSRKVKSEGLALINNQDEDVLRYLYKAWVARNPKRGFHFLRTYLQLLFPDAWKISQWWQNKNLPYPSNLKTEDEILESERDQYFLTSRISAIVDLEKTSLRAEQVAPALRSNIAARFVFELWFRQSLTSKLHAHAAVSTNHRVQYVDVPIVNSPCCIPRRKGAINAVGINRNAIAGTALVKCPRILSKCGINARPINTFAINARTCRPDASVRKLSGCGINARSINAFAINARTCRLLISSTPELRGGGVGTFAMNTTPVNY